MEKTLYIQTGVLFKIVQDIPGSASGDTVTITIKRLSDGYTWNFSTLVFENASNSGSMTFDSNTFWKYSSFTPPTADQYLVRVNDSTIDAHHTQTLIAQGASVASGLTGAELTTLANLREFLKKETADTTDDGLLQNIITRMSTQVAKKCNRQFARATYTEYQSGNGLDYTFVKNPPINSITSVHIDSDRDWTANTLVDADDVHISDQDSGKIILDGDQFSPSDVENVRIIYNGGFATIPQDLEQAFIRLCAAEYIDAGGVVQAKTGAKDPRDIAKEAWEYIVQNYRMMPIC